MKLKRTARFLSLMLILAMAVSLLPGTVLAGSAFSAVMDPVKLGDTEITYQLFNVPDNIKECSLLFYSPVSYNSVRIAQTVTSSATSVTFELPKELFPNGLVCGFYEANIRAYNTEEQWEIYYNHQSLSLFKENLADVVAGEWELAEVHVGQNVFKVGETIPGFGVLTEDYETISFKEPYLCDKYPYETEYDWWFEVGGSICEDFMDDEAYYYVLDENTVMLEWDDSGFVTTEAKIEYNVGGYDVMTIPFADSNAELLFRRQIMDKVQYLAREWNESKQQVVESSESTTSYRLAESRDSTALWPETTTIYVVNKDVTINGDLLISGSKKIILCDGCTMTVNGQIFGDDTASLQVYGQSKDQGNLIISTPSVTSGDGKPSINVPLSISGGKVNITGGSTTDSMGACTAVSSSYKQTGGEVSVYANASTMTVVSAIRGNAFVYGGQLTANAVGMMADTFYNNLTVNGGSVNAVSNALISYAVGGVLEFWKGSFTGQSSLDALHQIPYALSADSTLVKATISEKLKDGLQIKAGSDDKAGNWDKASELTEYAYVSLRFGVKEEDHPSVISGGGEDSYSIAKAAAKNGSFAVSCGSAEAGKTVTVTVTPDEGFAVDAVTVTDNTGKSVSVTGAGDNKYTFTMPASAVTVSVTFKESKAAEEEETTASFVDVKESDYFYDAVQWAAEKGITKGIDATHFGPTVGTTRAQVVTFLWRAAGSPEPTGTTEKFTDLKPNEYYQKAIAWAIEQGITKGTSATTFSPDEVCTRAQITTFLARYAGVEDANTESTFSDVKATDYFAAAVKWAKDNGVTDGVSKDAFGPDQDCTRAQTVTFLYRWVEK